MFSIGKFLIILGIIFIVTGFLFLIFQKVPILRLPGDIVIKKDNFIFYFPVVSSIVLSIILTIIINLIFRK
ncbi:MAG: DUF2905 domain-containing protein [candidate division WOR-3 bacterium]